MATRPATKSTERKSSKPKQPEFDRELAARCEQLIGWRVASMQYPGGESRDSIKLILKKSAPVYASTRSRKNKADIERLVLKTIHRAGGKVPKLLGSDGDKLLIQEDIPGQRLTQALHNRSSKTMQTYLDAALESLSRIQQAGSENGLDEKLPPLGNSDKWLDELLERPVILGKFLDSPAPSLARDTLKSMLKIRKPRFVKWDSRPGNAIARDNGEIYWIDWEHSGARNRLDDMVWLLADEFVPDRPAMEASLLEKFLPEYADDLSLAQARHYFFALGVFHLVVRLGLILKYKKDGSWWSYSKCLAGDKAGVTLRNTNRICDRGARWALENPETADLSSWFEEIRDRLQ